MAVSHIHRIPRGGQGSRPGYFREHPNTPGLATGVALAYRLRPKEGNPHSPPGQMVADPLERNHAHEWST